MNSEKTTQPEQASQQATMSPEITAPVPSTTTDVTNTTTTTAPTTGTGQDISAAPPAYNTSQGVHENYAPHEKSDPTSDTTHPNGPQNGPGPVMVIPLTALGREEATVDCPRCRQAVKTRIERHAGQRATIWGVLICLCVGCLCAWIPCVISDCKDVEHFCSSCNLMLANVTPGGAVELSQPARASMAEASRHGTTAAPNANTTVKGTAGGLPAQPSQYASAPAMEAGQAQGQQQQPQPETARQETGTVTGQETGTVSGTAAATTAPK